MRCLACGKDNREDARFCRGCGRPLTRTCAGCGAALPDDAAFCDRCGAAVDAPPAPAPTPAPASYTPAHLAARIRASRQALEGERKLVTVLFADVVESTAIAERLDPEEMRTLMDRCFGHMLEEVHRYEGTVNQFTGDGVMALFGAPLALEDAPRRAVTAGLAIQAALAGCRAELRDACRVELQVRIGIHTGLVVVGRIGNDLRMEYTAIGDTTNLAARLQALAPAGAVVVSETTQRLAGAFFETRDLGLQRVKGKRSPVRVYEVVRERAARGRIEAVGSEGLTPLTGRTRELAALEKAFDDAREGRGQVVFVVGEAGIGKSRLLWEFRRALGDAPHRWVEGRCASYGTTTAFLPIADAFRRALGIDDRDDEAAMAAKIDAAAPADLAWTRPFLRLLLSLPSGDAAADALDPAMRRSETFRALKALNLRAAETRPLVVVVEDLHWIDPASEEYLAFLAESVPTARVLLVCTHRTGYRHPFGDRSYHRRVVLDPLSDADMAAMAGAIVAAGELPAALRELILRKAEGNPLFVEEVTKSLLEDGALRREDGRVVLARELAATAVPDSIQGVLMARLDRLADDPKRALQMASVIGREFALRLLARVSEMGEQVSALVSELRGLELIYEKAVHPELAYMFKHALTHDVAYESILLQRRRELHRTIGGAIEELYGDRLAEHYETLAFHFARGEDWRRAFEYHRLAAAKSLAAYANHAAIAHCREALAVADRAGGDATAAARRELEQMLAMAYLLVSEFRASGEAFVRAAEHAEDDGARSLALGWAGYSFVWAHDYDRAASAVREAGALAEARHLPAGRALAIVVQAFMRDVTEGAPAEHLEATQHAIALAARCGEEDVHGLAVLFLGEGLEWRGRFREAIVQHERARAIAGRIGNPSLLVMSSWWLGKCHCCLGDYTQALRFLQESEALCARLGNRAWHSRLLNTLGWCLAEIGDHAAAIGHNREAARLAREVGDPEILSNAEINLALNHLALGDVAAAAAHVDPIAAAVAAPGDPWMRWRYALHAHDALGRVALARGEPERVLELTAAELAGARRHDASKLEARALELRARALLALERREEAAATVAALDDLAERLEWAPARWQTLGLLAELARRDGRRTEADAHRARAAAFVAALAAPLPEPLRRALYATARVE